MCQRWAPVAGGCASPHTPACFGCVSRTYHTPTHKEPFPSCFAGCSSSSSKASFYVFQRTTEPPRPAGSRRVELSFQGCLLSWAVMQFSPLHDRSWTVRSRRTVQGERASCRGDIKDECYGERCCQHITSTRVVACKFRLGAGHFFGDAVVQIGGSQTMAIAII